MKKVGENEKDNKYRLTTWVSREKAMLAKENGYNFSKLMEDSLNIILNINGDDEVKIQRKIHEIEKKIHDLELERQLLFKELERIKYQIMTNNEGKKRIILVNKLSKELKDSGDVKDLAKHAAELEMTDHELLEILEKRAYN